MEDTGGGQRWVMGPDGLRRLVDLLVERFDAVVGPVVAEGVVRLRPIASADDLPVGVNDDQEPASYRLHAMGSALRFSYGPSLDSLKSIVHPPSTPVWTMHRRDGSLVVESAHHATNRTAIIGARACDVRALAVLERTQTQPHADPAFTANRHGLFIVTVDCTVPPPTCFCDTAGGGGASEVGHDLALTELDRPDGVTYVVRAGSEAGRSVVESLGLEPAGSALVSSADAEVSKAMGDLVRRLPADAREAVLISDHPRWADVGDRCLTCGNCTAVCPTCFCTDMVDDVSLDGATSTRTRVWDTCFSLEYSHLGPGPHRRSPAARYRQWLSHKLGTWHDQYGESGCVGCGRCITWCPVGIDIVAEVEALASSEAPA